MEKMEKKKKNAANGKTGGPKRNNRGTIRSRAGFRGRGARIKRGNVGVIVKKQQQQQIWQRNANNTNNVRGFAKNRFKKNLGNLTRSRSNLSLNQKTNARGAFNIRRGRNNRFPNLTRSRSRTNLTFNQGGFFTNNKSPLKRTSSLPNLRDPNSVHNRLGYQSPAQIAYRNRVKRAKQLLLQRQNQRLNLQNQFRLAQTGAQKNLLTMQPRSTLARQQILTSQRRFTTGGLRSDQIARAQRRAQYEQKLMRMNSARLTPTPNVNFMCTLGSEYTPTPTRPRLLTLAPTQHIVPIGGMRQLPRGRSPYRQNAPGVNMVGRAPLFRQRSRSRSRSRSGTHNTNTSDSSGDVDDRSFSEVMYSLSGNLGVTGRTLNDRFSF
ncbi:uncharacterized protein LOC114928503 isoform X2 [Nylanderia fulva]|nr:uncharacterized protein LOC114928503 isoform X2 [Nylanderia fulva]